MVSSMLRNNDLHFVMMGGCWPETYKDYLNVELHGHLLSVIESSDPHGTCVRLLDSQTLKSAKEVILNTGLSHGFIYKGYAAWIRPIMDWYSNHR
jgi:hypothetical protein